MTDEQIKVAPVAYFLMDQLMDVWAAAIPREQYAEATQNVISALQKDGQYIVFRAPAGYRFGAPCELSSGDYFPTFSVLTQEVDLVPAGGCVGLTTLTLEPLTGGVE
jgi:hypothetical protein